jgi:hypothetical protein
MNFLTIFTFEATSTQKKCGSESEVYHEKMDLKMELKECATDKTRTIVLGLLVSQTMDPFFFSKFFNFAMTSFREKVFSKTQIIFEFPD